eukprot:COSAG01_NODE_20717_length_938_cov_11.765197_2_plen_58_part_01
MCAPASNAAQPSTACSTAVAVVATREARDADRRGKLDAQIEERRVHMRQIDRCAHRAR